jgi:hypothetical protein
MDPPISQAVQTHLWGRIYTIQAGQISEQAGSDFMSWSFVVMLGPGA